MSTQMITGDKFENFESFLSKGRAHYAKGPLALIFAEDLVEVSSTLWHHVALGFERVILFAPEEVELAPELAEHVIWIPHNTRAPGMLTKTVNALIDAAPDVWMYYCYNAEYLFFPFCETRSVKDLLAFHSEERRDGMLTYVVDIYADDLTEFPNAVSLEYAYMDKTGYYALGRDGIGGPKERQLDFFGGVRWRYEEHLAKPKRRIDRIALFRAKKGLKLLEHHVFNEEEYNTFSCPWHHNLTASIASFRVAKALRENPGSKHHISSYIWHNSVRFEWDSKQLLDLGLMEPGQWF